MAEDAPELWEPNGSLLLSQDTGSSPQQRIFEPLTNQGLGFSIQLFFPFSPLHVQLVAASFLIPNYPIAIRFHPEAFCRSLYVGVSALDLSAPCQQYRNSDEPGLPDFEV